MKSSYLVEISPEMSCIYRTGTFNLVGCALREKQKIEDFFLFPSRDNKYSRFLIYSQARSVYPHSSLPPPPHLQKKSITELIIRS